MGFLADLFDPKEPEAPAQDFTYAPPDLKSLYAQFKEKGTVPYSYYGAGAPTNQDELKRVRGAYPGAFTAPAQQPAAAPQQPQNPFERLIAALRKGKN